MFELASEADHPIEWVEANDACLAYGSEGVPTLEAAREFIRTGQRVDAQTWHFYGDIIDCVFEGRVLVGETYGNFRAHLTGAGSIWRDLPSNAELILCTRCEAWGRPEIGGEF